MLPVSITAIMIRIIFKLKLADIVINVTSGGPGGCHDTVTSFIFREYRDRSNVGYGTMLAMVYLVIIVVAMTLLMKLAGVGRGTGHDRKSDLQDGEADQGFRGKWFASRAVIYGFLILWAVICLFPIYWTVTTSFKTAPDVMQGALLPWVDYLPKWLAGAHWACRPTRSRRVDVRDEFLKRFVNSAVTSVASSSWRSSLVPWRPMVFRAFPTGFCG